MKVLVACEESQTVCKAFRKRGHEAYSCDIQECSGGHPEWHINDDALKYLNPYFSESDLTFGVHFVTSDGTPHFINGKWDLIIAHPPCTYMSKAGARHMYKQAGVVNEERLIKALAAKEFFMRFFYADCPCICIENPTPLKIVKLPNATQVIQPFEFGEPYSKRTLLWLRGLPPLKPTEILSEYGTYLPSNTSNYSKGKGGGKGIANTSKLRSKTFEGIAKAMAE